MYSTPQQAGGLQSPGAAYEVQPSTQSYTIPHQMRSISPSHSRPPPAPAQHGVPGHPGSYFYNPPHGSYNGIPSPPPPPPPSSAPPPSQPPRQYYSAPSFTQPGQTTPPQPYPQSYGPPPSSNAPAAPPGPHYPVFAGSQNPPPYGGHPQTTPPTPTGQPGHNQPGQGFSPFPVGIRTASPAYPLHPPAQQHQPPPRALNPQQASPTALSPTAGAGASMGMVNPNSFLPRSPSPPASRHGQGPPPPVYGSSALSFGPVGHDAAAQAAANCTSCDRTRNLITNYNPFEMYLKSIESNGIRKSISQPQMAMMEHQRGGTVYLGSVTHDLGTHQSSEQRNPNAPPPGNQPSSAPVYGISPASQVNPMPSQFVQSRNDPNPQAGVQYNFIPMPQGQGSQYFGTAPGPSWAAQNPQALLPTSAHQRHWGPPPPGPSHQPVQAPQGHDDFNALLEYFKAVGAGQYPQFPPVQEGVPQGAETPRRRVSGEGLNSWPHAIGPQGQIYAGQVPNSPPRSSPHRARGQTPKREQATPSKQRPTTPSPSGVKKLWSFFGGKR